MAKHVKSATTHNHSRDTSYPGNKERARIEESPHYRVKAVVNDTSFTIPVGWAWLESDGAISIRLDRGVALKAAAVQLIKLFPVGGKQSRLDR